MDTCVELNKQGDENSTVDDGNYKRRRMADAVTRLLEDEGSEGDSEADLVQPAEVVSADDDGD
ncbi:hypothetical protein DIPPA_14132 [Diplonema papillatum]|nr:hypothetical protein DIPPA_14132 [Diplonema papillatum]